MKSKFKVYLRQDKQVTLKLIKSIEGTNEKQAKNVERKKKQQRTQ